MSELKLGFEMKKIRLPLGDILPVRQIGGQERIDRYQTIVRSIKEVGMVEPLMVHPQKGASGKYLLVDGHLRLHALRELGETEADCIIANDDESYTYNARISRMAPIQEHKMILRAVQQGKVKPERIAAALNIPLSHVQSSLTLLDGINPEAVDLLKDKLIAPKAIRCLKKVSGVRQIEIAELMVSVNNYTAGYAEALVFGTPKDQLADPAEPKKKDGLSPEEIGRMEQEMETLEHDLKAVEESYGENVLNLTCARGYIKRLLDNAKVVRFLNANYSDVCSEFQAIAAAETL
jgi:ParB/RepB/Spo0J family partition protein